MSVDIRADLPDRLRAFRRARNWTAADMAAECAVNRAEVYRWEHGERLPSLPVLCRIADALDVSFDLLLGSQP